MSKYQLTAMVYNSKEQIEAILSLERQCKQYEQISISANIEHLTMEDGDHALLCYHDEKLIALLSWYTADGIQANISGMVDPDYRRQGVFRSLLQRAKEDMKPLELQTLCCRIPAGSQSGFGFVQSLEASFNRSEYAMRLGHFISNEPRHSNLRLRLHEPQDFEFMVHCQSQAFGEPESWSREYLNQTNQPSRSSYIAMLDDKNVGLIRINHIDQTTTFIHDFCILPSFQGKGIGQDVLSEAVGILMEEQYSHIRLSVVTENEIALNLYLRVGFEVTAENQYYVSSL
ncbi:MAG: GNAT family N-acetyltransferase [Candidatus Pristimantibacillus sp.]